MRRLFVICLIVSCCSAPAFAAPWTQLFDVVATDPNGGAATSHEFQMRIDGGAWSLTQTEATPSTQFTAAVDHGSTLEVQGRPCDSGLCADWVVGSVTVPGALLPYGTITINVSWTKP